MPHPLHQPELFQKLFLFEDGDALLLIAQNQQIVARLDVKNFPRIGRDNDLPFVAQYIQSAQVAREFISYYHQYSTIIASGLADAVFTNSLTEKQEKKLS